MYLRTLMLLFLWAPWIAQADSVLVKEALKQLIERQEASTTKASQSSGSDQPMPSTTASRRSETLLPNETLDGLIKRTWPGLPSKEVWVRRSFVDLNPKAFIQGNPNLLQPGATLSIPLKSDLRASFARAYPAVASLFETPEVLPIESKSPESSSPTPPRWVRFP